MTNVNRSIDDRPACGPDCTCGCQSVAPAKVCACPDCKCQPTCTCPALQTKAAARDAGRA
jgi:hypothetical protein